MLSWKYLEGLNYPGCFSFRISFLHPSASQPLLPHISTSPRPHPLHSSFPPLPSHLPHPDLCPSSKSAWHFNHGVRKPDRIAKPPRSTQKGVRVRGGRAALHGAAANPLRHGNLKKPKAPIENLQVKRRVSVGVVLLPANRWLREREVGE